MSKNYEVAKELYAQIGVDTEKAIETLNSITISMNCWQGDDLGGYEIEDGKLSSGGIQATGNYPGRPKTLEQLKADISKTFTLIGGKKKLNLHSIYLNNGGSFVERNKFEPHHYDTWIDFAKKENVGLDFNPTFFSHEKAKGDQTLSSPDKAIRDYWIEHGICCRKIGEYLGKEIGQRCVTDFWMPDGLKDTPIDREAPRMRLKESLDTIFAVDIDKKYNVDAVESKLFGIGTESYVVGSHEFYMAYCQQNKDVMVCLDEGHFHPSEGIHDKLSVLGMFYNEFLLHLSRGVRWDSDHVVILDDELRLIAHDIIAANLLGKANIATDYFDASINRMTAWVVGIRSIQKAFLAALLEPMAKFKQIELEGDYTSRLALTEEMKAMPFGIVYDEFCERNNVPKGMDWLPEVKAYEKSVLNYR